MDRREEDDGREIEQPEGSSGEGSEGSESEDGSADLGASGADEEELLKNEDAIQTAARLLAKSKDSETESGESFEEETTEDEAHGDSDESAASGDEEGEAGGVDDDLEPPVRLTAEAKQAFKKWPKKAKQEFSEAVKNLEAAYYRSNQKLTDAQKEADHIVRAVRPYYASKPELAEKGITEAQIVAGLVGNHQMLTHEDPNTRLRKFIAIGKSINILDEEGNFKYDLEGGTGGQVDQTAINQAINAALQTELGPLKSHIETQQKAQQNENAKVIAEDIKSVMDETDNLGNYVYPELHDSDYHAQQVRPLVAGLVRSMPNLGYGAATRMAVAHLRSQNGKSNSPNPTRLPTNNDSYKERAARAGASVRGKATANSNVDKLSPTQQRIMEEFPIGGR